MSHASYHRHEEARAPGAPQQGRRPPTRQPRRWRLESRRRKRTAKRAPERGRHLEKEARVFCRRQHRQNLLSSCRRLDQRCPQNQGSAATTRAFAHAQRRRCVRWPPHARRVAL